MGGTILLAIPPIPIPILKLFIDPVDAIPKLEKLFIPIVLKLNALLIAEALFVFVVTIGEATVFVLDDDGNGLLKPVLFGKGVLP